MVNRFRWELIINVFRYFLEDIILLIPPKLFASLVECGSDSCVVYADINGNILLHLSPNTFLKVVSTVASNKNGYPDISLQLGALTVARSDQIPQLESAVWNPWGML